MTSNSYGGVSFKGRLDDQTKSYKLYAKLEMKKIMEH